MCICFTPIVVVQSLSHAQPTPWTATLIPYNHLILCRPLLLLPSVFPSIRVFSHESALHIRWYWSFSFSISPSNIHGWFLLGLTGFSPCCPRDSQKSSPAPQFESVNSLVLSLLYGPTLTSIHDYWKNHSFDYIYGLLLAKWSLCFLKHCLGLT